MSGHLICRDNPNGNLVGGLGRTRGSFALCILIFCRFDPRHVSIRDRSNRTWSMFARHEEVDLHAPNFQSRAFVIAFLAPTRWKGRSTFASTGLRLRSWLRRYKGRRHREREREREREKEREPRRGRRRGDATLRDSNDSTNNNTKSFRKCRNTRHGVPSFSSHFAPPSASLPRGFLLHVYLLALLSAVIYFVDFWNCLKFY